MRCSIIADACDAVVVGYLSVEQLRRLADRERAPDGLERQLHDARGSPRSSSTLTGRLTRRTASIPIVVHYLKQRLLHCQHAIKQVRQIINLLIRPSYSKVLRFVLYNISLEGCKIVVRHLHEFGRLLKIDQFGHFILSSFIWAN